MYEHADLYMDQTSTAFICQTPKLIILPWHAELLIEAYIEYCNTIVAAAVGNNMHHSWSAFKCDLPKSLIPLCHQ